MWIRCKPKRSSSLLLELLLAEHSLSEGLLEGQPPGSSDGTALVRIQPERGVLTCIYRNRAHSQLIRVRGQARVFSIPPLPFLLETTAA